jgi:hypothetical protein
VRWHHESNPELRQNVKAGTDESDLIDLVIIANWIVNKMQFGFSGHEDPEAPSDALLARLNIYQLDHLIADVQRELKITEDFCAILDSNS